MAGLSCNSQFRFLALFENASVFLETPKPVFTRDGSIASKVSLKEYDLLYITAAIPEYLVLCIVVFSAVLSLDADIPLNSALIVFVGVPHSSLLMKG